MSPNSVIVYDVKMLSQQFSCQTLACPVFEIWQHTHICQQHSSSYPNILLLMSLASCLFGASAVHCVCLHTIKMLPNTIKINRRWIKQQQQRQKSCNKLEWKRKKTEIGTWLLKMGEWAEESHQQNVKYMNESSRLPSLPCGTCVVR